MKFCSQAFTVALHMSAYQLSGKEPIKPESEPCCSEPWHVKEDIGSREWGGQTALTLNVILNQKATSANEFDTSVKHLYFLIKKIKVFILIINIKSILFAFNNM